MKFSISSIINDSKGRLGSLVNIPRCRDVELETPMLLLYTKGGSIPHVTREVLDLLTHERFGIQISLPSTIQCFEGARAFGKGIAPFVGLKEMPTYCSVQDPAVLTPEGYNCKDEISIWSHKGRVPLNVDRFMDLIEVFQPDFYHVLCNGDTNEMTSKKKTKKVSDSSHKLLDQCLERHQSSLALKSIAVFGSIEGGYDVDLRKLSAQLVASKPVDGFVIDGLHNNGREVENIDFEKVVPLLEASLKYLPEEKPRIIHGCWRPEHVLKMFDLGIDIFDSSLAYIVTERMSALTFKCCELSSEPNEFDHCSKPMRLEICLKDERYKEDFKPILEDCSCLTCIKHTRAYIYHLISNKELLAGTLLMFLCCHPHASTLEPRKLVLLCMRWYCTREIACRGGRASWVPRC